MQRFSCPQCRQPLLAEKDDLACKPCSLRYPIKDGIPSFSSTSSYFFGEVDKAAIDRCIELAEKEGWNKALNDYLRPISPDTYQYATDYSRADWRFLLPLSKESKVLDLGSGWGIISLALARTCGSVVSMDETYEKVRFLNIRKTQEKVDNITVVHAGDLLELPFPDREFDAVVMNGVLEWTGVSSHEADPLTAQKKFLKSTHRCLKDNGILYLGIENRCGYNYFLGDRDHNGLRFVGLLPRRLADIYSRLAGKGSYKTLIHSYRAYRRLLNQAGFGSLAFYFPVPSYRYPLFTVPLKDPSLLKYFVAHLFPTEKKRLAYTMIRLTSKLLFILGLMPYLVPSYIIVARKREAPG
jgi:SAM-dependent methyltransferase